MQSGVAQPTGNMVKDARTTIKSIAADILRRNPQLKNDPATLMAAVNQTITSMKGLEPEMRDYMGLEAKLAQVQAAGEAAVLKAKTSEEATAAKLDIATKQMAILQAKVESYERVQKGHDQARTAVAGTAASARVQSAGIAAKGGTDRANIAAGASRDVAGTRADAARDVAGTRADASTSGARINASMGKSDAPAPRAGRTAPVRVQTPAQAQALKPGTHYITPDGQELIR